MTLKVWFIVGLAIIILLGGAFFIRLLLLASDSRKHHLFLAPSLPADFSTSSSISGAIKNRLKPCPQSLNCYLTAIKKEKRELAKIKDMVVAMGGEVKMSTADYFHSVFTTQLFRYTDDLEVLIKGEEIQIRSASRVGYSDMGVNQKRVESLIDRIN